MNKTKLYAFNSIVSLLKRSFCEREPHNNLFPHLLQFMDKMKYEFSFADYIKLELKILSEAGYELQLNRCAVTGESKDLYYVSPKSGKAVSKQVGAPYAEKLLKLPNFLKQDARGEAELTSIEKKTAAELTSYFFNRYVMHGKPEPHARTCFFEMML